MAAVDRQFAQGVSSELVGDEEVIKLLRSLPSIVSNEIVLAAMKKGGAIINQQAQSNFMAQAQNKSTTNYAGFSSMFKVSAMKAKYGESILIGMQGKQVYKYRWAQWGTADRTTKGGKSKKTEEELKPRYSGKIRATHFFYNAVASKKDDAIKIISDSIIMALNEYQSKLNSTT